MPEISGKHNVKINSFWLNQVHSSYVKPNDGMKFPFWQIDSKIYVEKKKCHKEPLGKRAIEKKQTL